MDRIDYAIPLELYPDAVRADTRKGEIELNLRRAICDKRMRVDHVDNVVACRQHVAPGAKVLLEAVARRYVEAHLCVPSRNGLRWDHREFDFDVLSALRRIVLFQRRRRWRVSRNKNRFSDKLRRGAFGIEIAENAIHPGFRKCHIVLKRVVQPKRVIMDENLKVLAHDERVKQLLVDNIEFFDRIVLPGIVHVKPEVNLLAWFRHPRGHSQIEMVLDWIGNSGK